ncbi:anthranilate synthase component I [Cutibacterium sp. WCA-380-WT-3A]|uniref:Anthranilate synthase component 1 n=1 Tax=Cutibacterium porci TaxID=2605781 RepID=A0A7K0J6D4_9ACTN|nr:chorismate-binding protein [Cutibacterium porci]MSS45526.1 anthranilate synthase component I [Cutibacterium porci]
MIDVAPSRQEFAARAAHHTVVSVRTKLVCDDDTPVGLYQHLCGDRGLTFLLESAESGIWSRWSFIGVNARCALISDGDSVGWIGDKPGGLTVSDDPLEALKEALADLSTPAEPDLPPLTSGFVGYIGYDMVRRLESIGDDVVDDLGLPAACLMLVGDMAVFDHQRGELWLISNQVVSGTDPDQAYDAAVCALSAMVARLAEPREVLTARIVDHPAAPVRRQRTPAQYAELVDEAVDRIRDGDIFQVVPSQRFDVETRADALNIYRQLRRTNPSPYLYLLRLPGFDVIGSSPEALVTVADGVATTHPIAGTRPRGRTAAEDRAMEDELLADPKERSEHTMLVDLGRNDLGRVCVPGTVNVTEFMHVGRYSHVMHLEAAVTGQIAAGMDAVDVTMSCFPAGTLSGAPKISAMRIIEMLETTRRGVYGGVVGYFDLHGNSDCAIAIRTAVLKDHVAHVQAGAGIVLDSIGSRENAECENKAAAVIQAVQDAELLSGLREDV